MRFVTKLGVAGALAALAWPAVSMSAEMRGVTATEIKIGQTMPYSGPVSAFGALGKGEVAYFKMLNEQRRHQRPQDQPDFARRQLRAAEDGGADPAAGGERRGRADLLLDRHRP